MPTIIERAQRAWDALRGKDPALSQSLFYYGSSSSYRPDRHKYSRGNERSIMSPLLSRIAADAAGVAIKHVKLDDKDRFKEEINDGLNDIFNLEANIDQTGRAFLQDIYASMLDEGVIAIVPVDGEVNFETKNITSIESARVGKIVTWHPQHVEVELYNDKTGKHEHVTIHKRLVAICENPFYAIMNEPNSIAQRLRRKLVLLDQMDEQTASGKLDLIIQLPYTTRTDARRKQAETRKKDIEVQLAGSKYGVAYTDASEKIIQLNRSLDNNLVPQIEKLEKQLQDQLGIGPEILNGTATEQQLLNYTNNIIEPIVSTIVTEVRRKFLTKTARTQKEDIMFFRDPFRLVPVNNIADIADKFTRNCILSSNELRGIIGFEPSDDPKADQLINSNLNQSNEELVSEGEETPLGDISLRDLPDIDEEE